MLARVHSINPDRGIPHPLRLPAEPDVARLDPDSAAAGLVPAFAIDWALEKLGWKNPAPPAQFRRCVDVIARWAAT